MSRLLGLLAQPLSGVSPLPAQYLNPLPHWISRYSQLVTHLTSTPVHPDYLPFLRFTALHAARTTFIWTGLSRLGVPRGTKRSVSWVGDLFGYLTLAWGGTTLVCLLTSQPPPWLVSPLPWLAYPLIYLTFAHSGIAYFIRSIPADFRPLIDAWEDGFCRGVGLSGLPTLLASSPSFAAGANWWTHALLSGIMVSGGGWLVQLFSLSDLQGGYKLAMPAILGPGLLNKYDTTAGVLAGLLHCVLTRTYADLDFISDAVAPIVPVEFAPAGAKSTFLGKTARVPLVDPAVARAITIVFLGSLYFVKALVLYVNGVGEWPPTRPERFGKAPGSQKHKTAVDAVQQNEKKSEVAVTPTKAKVGQIAAGENRSREGTPKRRKTPGSAKSKLS